MSYDNWKTRSPDDEVWQEFPPCIWVVIPEYNLEDDVGQYCKVCGAGIDDKCPWEDKA